MSDEKVKDAAKETQELDQLLEQGAATGEGKFRLKGIKPIWLILGGVLLVALIVAVEFFMNPAPGGNQETAESGSPTEGGPENDSVQDETSGRAVNEPSSKENVYALQPFFLPLLEKGKETGRFIHVTPHFRLSSGLRHKNVELALPLIRRSIYNILRRRNPQEFKGNLQVTKETIKKEILITANASLRKGVGSIDDVYYVQFLVK